MTDRQMQNFLYVADQGSLSKAASLAFISTPSLKAQMDDLERELQATLLLRSSKGVELTENGRLFYDFCQRSLESVEELRQKLHKDLSEQGEITVAYRSDHIRDNIYYGFLLKFSSIYPGISVKLIQVDSFYDCSFDVFIGTNDVLDENYISVLLCDFPVYLIAKKIQLRGHKKQVLLSDLKMDDYLLPPEELSRCICPDLMMSLSSSRCKFNYCKDNKEAYIWHVMTEGKPSIIIGKELYLPDSLSQIKLEGFKYPYVVYFSKEALKRKIMVEYLHQLTNYYQNYADI